MATSEVMALMQQAAEQAEAKMRAKLEEEMAAKIAEKEAAIRGEYEQKEAALEEKEAALNEEFKLKETALTEEFKEKESTLTEGFKEKEVELEARVKAEGEAQRTALAARAAELDTRAAELDLRVQAVRGAEARSTGRVVLDVGGTLFTTSESTLRAADRGESDDNVLSLLSRRTKAGADGRKEIFLDRSPEIYPALLNYLRTGTLPVDSMSRQQLRCEAEYLGLDALLMRAGGRAREGARSLDSAASAASAASSAAVEEDGEQTRSGDDTGAELVTWTQDQLTAALVLAKTGKDRNLCRLTHLNLDGLNFMGHADLVSSFQGSTLNGAVLGRGPTVSLTGATSFEGLVSSGCVLAFSGTAFAGMRLIDRRLRLSDCVLAGAVFTSCTFRGLGRCAFAATDEAPLPVFKDCTFHSENTLYLDRFHSTTPLTGVDFTGSQFSNWAFNNGAALRGAIVKSCVFQKIEFDDLVLDGVDFSGSTFSSCSFKKVKFAGACFDDCEFTGGRFEYSTFAGADTKKTSFRGATGIDKFRKLTGKEDVDFTDAT